MTVEQTRPTSALEELQQWVDREKRENGLQEIHFTVGSDPDTTPEEAARVTLAMLRYQPSA